MRAIPKAVKKNPGRFPPITMPNTLLPRFTLNNNKTFDTPEEAANACPDPYGHVLSRTYPDTTSYDKKGEFASNRCTDSELARFYSRLAQRFPPPPRQREEMEEPIW